MELLNVNQYDQFFKYFEHGIVGTSISFSTKSGAWFGKNISPCLIEGDCVGPPSLCWKLNNLMLRESQLL